MVPVDAGPEVWAVLDRIFLVELNGVGIGGGSSRRVLEFVAPFVERLAAAVAGIGIYMAAGNVDAIMKPQPLRLDRDRLVELDEAWIPVVTPDGPGVLIWQNSD